MSENTDTTTTPPIVEQEQKQAPKNNTIKTIAKIIAITIGASILGILGIIAAYCITADEEVYKPHEH